MKCAVVKRWKTKERRFNQKYKLKTLKKSSYTRDLTGKFVLLLSKTHLCAVLRFLSKSVCVAESIIVADDKLINLISPKFKIPYNKHNKLLTQSEIRITKYFFEKFENVFGKFVFKENIHKESVTEIPEIQNNSLLVVKNVQKNLDNTIEARKITPIKILSCKICNQKFLKRELLEEHLVNAHKNEDSSGSENELHIDDDVELLLENDHFESSNLNLKNVDNIKVEIKTPVKTKQFKCLECSALCASEDSLLSHIERTHPCSSASSPRHLMSYDFHANPKKSTLNDSSNRKRSLSSTSSSLTSSTSKPSSVKSPAIEQKSKLQRSDTQPKTEFMCKICSTVFKDRKFLNRHIMSMHLSKVFRCYRCNVPFNKKLQLIRHLQAAHLKYKDEEGYTATLSDLESVGCFQCCFCKYSSKVKLKVEQHMTNEHYEDFEKDDGQEDSISSSPDSLEELLLPETKALMTQSDFNEEELLTEITTKEDDDLYVYKKRKPANDPSFRYRCARCMKRFSRSTWLKKHSCVGLGIKIKAEPEEQTKPRVVNEVNGFLKCREKTCNKVFTDRKHYDQHIKTAH